MYLVPQEQAPNSDCAWCAVQKNPRLLVSPPTPVASVFIIQYTY